MSQLTLITSLPPPILKGDKLEIDVDKYKWQSLCINSWINSGHEVVSFNEIDEIQILKQIYTNINFIPSTRTTREINGRPLIYISDAFSAVKYFDSSRIAICNADVFITMQSEQLKALTQAKDITFSNRININNIDDTTGTLFGGIDYFNMSLDFVNKLPEVVFAIGLPWWDYWLPSFAICNGYKIHKLVDSNSNPILLHKIHKDVWNEADFCILGEHFFENLYSSNPKALNNLSLQIAYTNYQEKSSSGRIEYLTSLSRFVSQYINNIAV